MGVVVQGCWGSRAVAIGREEKEANPGRVADGRIPLQGTNCWIGRERESRQKEVPRGKDQKIEKGRCRLWIEVEKEKRR